MTENKIYFDTFGCKVNQSESIEIIEKANIIPEKKLNESETVVINCCSVTSKTLSKISKLINKSLSLENIKNIFLIGCISKELSNKYNQNSRIKIIGNSYKKNDIIEFLKRVPGCQPQPKLKTRAFIKIQDGCNNFCSYCIVPYLRYKLISIPIETIIEKIKNKISEGYKEIVLCGISIGNYGDDLSEPNYLYKLLKEISLKIKDEIRIRLTSINPDKLNDELIKILISEPIFCNHIHLPLQSGSDKILRLMKRKYNVNTFLKLIEKIKKEKDNTGITTDVIAGFPSETDEDIKDTANIIKETNFLRVHIFTYSDRIPADSVNLKFKIDFKLKKERYNLINELSKLSTKNFLQKMLNKELTVLIENNISKSKFNGYSSEYIMCKINEIEPSRQNNSFMNCKIINVMNNNVCLVEQ